MSLISVVFDCEDKTYIYLLPTSFVSAYVMLVTWSALASIPVECKIRCNSSRLNHST